jgi:hypothetical protein
VVLDLGCAEQLLFWECEQSEQGVARERQPRDRGGERGNQR